MIQRLARRALFTSTATEARASMKTPLAANRGTYPTSKGYLRLMKLQKEWTKDDGRRVFEKRGFTDLVILRFMELLGVSAVVAIFSHFFFMARPEFSPKRLQDKAEDSE